MQHTRGFMAIFTIGLLLAGQAYAQSNIDHSDAGRRYGWSENAGWTNLKADTANGVAVRADYLFGYAWQENVGWINFGDGTPEGSGPNGPATQYTNASASDCGVNNDRAGHLSGYAWSENAGWIFFGTGASTSLVTISSTGVFQGNAWGENIGWISFANVAPADVATVRTADLQVTKADGADPAPVDGILTYLLTIQNNGPDGALDVTVVDSLPAGSTLDSFSSPNGSCTDLGGSVSCNFGDVASGATATATINIVPNVQGMAVNVARVSGNPAAYDPNEANDWATENTRIVGVTVHQDDSFDTNNEQDPGSATGWSRMGVTYSDPGLNTSDYDGVTGAYRVRVFSNSTRFHISGWSDNRLNWLPYSSVGSNRYVRAKYHIYAAPHDSQTFTDLRELPNFEMRLASRFAVTANLHVYHHNQSDPGNNTLFQDLRPSTDPLNPSVYRLDFDPVDVPYLATGTSEGIMSGFDVFTIDAHDNGYLCMTERVIATYPQSLLADANALQTKVYAPSATDAGNLRIYNSATDLRIFSYVPPPGGSPAGTFCTQEFTGALGTHTESAAGVTLDTSAVPSNRIGFVERSFFAGASDGSSDHANRIRVDLGEQYKIRWHVTSTQTTTQQSWLWLLQRSVKYAYQQSLQLAGGWGSNGTGNLATIRQSVPGVGCLNPDQVVPGEYGGWYTVLYVTPLALGIRPEFPAGTPIETRMPAITAQPGPGVDLPSARDIKLAAQIYDSISAGAGAPAEQANFTIDRIEVRVFTVVQD